MCTSAGSYIYQESDVIHNMYFMYKGEAGFALPRFNSVYLLIEEGDMFGLIDIIYNGDSEEIESSSLSRKFTIKCTENSEFIMLSVQHLTSMRSEFPEVYLDIFSGQSLNLWATLKLKLKALQRLEGF